MEEKHCPRCKTRKPISEFVRNRARFDGLSGYCWPCHIEFCAEQRQRTRKQFIEALGGECVQCGFNDWRALQVDHIGGSGRTDRQTAGGSHTATFRAKVLAHRDEYQVLCANCNQIKRLEKGEHRKNYNRIAPTERLRRVTETVTIS